MAKRIHLGILTPSSNTSLEPLSQAIVSQISNVSVHFSRFPVLKISLDQDALQQFQNETILAAARLLADANVDIIGWSGTSSGWLGFQADEDLCKLIHTETGIPATTSVLALNKAIKALSVTELGLVTPYMDNVQSAIIKSYETIGVNCSKERHLRLSKNSSFADVEEFTLDEMVADVASNNPQAISTFCTNLRAAQRVEYWEKTHNVIVLDTVSTVIWDMMVMCQMDPAVIQGWGRLFQLRS